MNDFEMNGEEITPFDQILASLLDDSNTFPGKNLNRFSGLESKEISDFQKTWLKMESQRKLALLQDLEILAEGNSVMDFDAIAFFAIADEDDQIRENALRILWQTEDENYIPKIIEMLDSDESPEVRAQAAAVLGRFVHLGELNKISAGSYKKVEKQLFSTMEDENIDKVRQRALEALGYSSDSRVVGLIEDAYDFGEEDWQAASLFAMGRTADERWIPSVLERLDDPSTELSKEAARAAGEMEIEQAIPALLSLLYDDSTEIRMAAAWSLSQIGGSESAEALEEYQDRAEDEDEIDFIEEALDNLTFNLELDELQLLDLSKEDLESMANPDDNQPLSDSEENDNN